MKRFRPTARMGISVLAGGLAFVGSADATELIVDGSFENTTELSPGSTQRVGGKLNPGLGGGWSTFSTYLYSTQYTMPGPPNSGLQFLRPYPSGLYGVTQSSQVVTQLVSLTASLTTEKIDAGQGRYTMSAWFCTYRGDLDYSDLTLEFLNAAQTVVGTTEMLGGTNFYPNLPFGDNGRFSDAREWAQDVREGTVPAGARSARVRIESTALSGAAPDGYVELVSLDVSDASAGTPIVSSAVPGDNAVNAGPVINIGIQLQDRATAVNTNSIKLYLDDQLVTPSLIDRQNETNTIVQYAAGLLPALSAHTYKIVFADNGTPVTTQTNEFRFTVASYTSLPGNLRTPLGSEDTAKPGFNVNVYQVDTLIPPDEPLTAAQIDLPGSISFSEAVLAGLVGDNVADLTLAVATNRFEVPGVIDWVNFSGVSANFPINEPFPGIPGITGSEFSFIDDIQTFIRFPAAGFYQMGVNSDDQFRLTAATGGVQTLQISTSSTNMVIPSVVIATNLTQLQFGGALPSTPLSDQVIYATPSGNPDDACTIGTNTLLAGKIALLDRGATNCDSAFKAEQAQIAGAIAVIMTTPNDTGFPFRLDDVNPNVHIPVLVIAKNYGASALKGFLTNGTSVTATIQRDPSVRLGEWDGPKGFGAVDVTFGFGVAEAGVYPLRLVAGQGGGNANLEWFSIQPDGTKILVNDTSNPNALLAFRARTGTLPQDTVLSASKVAGGVSISWTGPGKLQEATTLTGPNNWSDSATQTNPQTVPTTGPAKFYRVQQ